MKRLLSILTICFLMILFPIRSYSIQKPKGFAGKVYDATYSLYGRMPGKQIQHLCTATLFRKRGDGYDLLSAGHCVALVPEVISYFVSSQVHGKEIPVTLYKFRYNGAIDFSIFHMKSDKQLPFIPVDSEASYHLGDTVLNVNFTKDIAKLFYVGRIASDNMIASENCDQCKGFYIADLRGYEGASGSAVISAKTHKIIGTVSIAFPNNVGVGIAPMSLFPKFLSEPSESRDQYINFPPVY